MTQIGTARLTVQADTASALKQLRSLASDGLKAFEGMKVAPSIDAAKTKNVLKQALSGMPTTVDIRVNVKPPKAADVRSALAGVAGQVTIGFRLKPPNKGEVNAALQGVAASKDVAVSVTGNALTKLQEIKAALERVRSLSVQALNVNVGAVTALIPQLRQQVAQLQQLENSLRTLRLNTGGGTGSGSGGGSPGRTNPYLDELRAWQTELKAGTATTAQFDQALVNLQGRLQSEVAALRSLGTLTQEDAAQMNQMKAALAAVNTQVNNTGITKLRSDLAAARTAFEQAIGAAGRFNFVGQRQATQAYEAEIARLTQRIGAMGQQAGVTQSQMRALNGISQQIASQQNAINGQFSQVGLAGNVVNALKSLPQFAMAAGGSLGAMAASGVQLSGVMTQLSALGGPVAMVIAGIGVAAFGLAKAFEDVISHAAEFEKQLQQISGLSGLNGAEMGKYADYVQDLSTKLPVTTEQLTEFGRQAVLVGLHGPQGVKTFTEGMAQLSTILRDVHGNAGGLEETGGEIVKVLRSMGMGTEEVNANFGKTINSLVALKTQFGVQIPDVTALATYFSSYAAKIGLTTDQILAFSASLVSVGARAQGSGSQLTKFFEKAAAAVAQGGEPLKEFAKDLGLSEEATKELLKTNPTAFLQRFAERLNVLHAQGIDSSIVLKGLGLDTNQAARTFNELAVASANTGRALAIAKKGFEDAGLAGRVAEETAKNYIDQMKEVHNAVDAIKANLGAFALPALSTMATNIKSFTDNLLVLSQEAKRGGPILDELKGYVYALGAALIFLRAQAIQTAAVSWVGSLGGLKGILPSLISGMQSLGAGAIAFGTRLAGAANAGMAFGGVRGAISGMAGMLRTVTIGIGGATAGLTIAVAAAVALAVTVNRMQGQLQETYHRTDQADQQTHEAMMGRVNELIAQHTKLGNAQAKFLLLSEQLREAQQGTVVGVTPLGERIYGPVDQNLVKKLQGDLAGATQNMQALQAADTSHAAAAKTNGEKHDAALRLTKEQLKTQLSAIKDITAELSKPVKLFGGTEFQQQFDQIAEKYRQLRDKLRQDVFDPKIRNNLSRQLIVRQGQEQTQTRQEYGTRASTAAAEAERQVQQARIQAMSEGSAKIKAQGEFDATEARRQAAEQAKIWRDFPAQKNRILAAGEAQAQMILQESHRKILEADRKAAEQRQREALAAVRKREAELRKARQDVATQQGLQRQLGNLVTNVQLKVDTGKLDQAGLNSFIQQLDGIKTKVQALPAPLRGVFMGLLQQASGLRATATAAATYSAEVAKLKANVKDMGYDELVAARNRVAGDATKARSLSLIDTELQKRQKLIKVKADEALGEGRRSQSKAAAQAVIDEYELARTRVKGRSDEAAQLLAIEQKSGADVLAARQQLAQVAAEEEIAQVKAKYRTLLQEVHGNSQKEAQLTEQEGREIASIRAKRDREQRANKVASDQALIEQTRATTAALLQAEKERQDGIRAVQSGESNNTLGLYELGKTYAQSENGENLAARLDLEQRGGAAVLKARENLARAAAQSEIEGLTITYQARIDKEKAGSVEAVRLAEERDTLIAQRGAALEIELARVGREQLLARAQAQKAFNDAMLKLDRDLQDSLSERDKVDADYKKSQAERDLQDELASVEGNEKAKLEILQRDQTTRIALAEQTIRLETNAREQAENRRWEDLQKSQEWLSADSRRRAAQEEEHQDRLTEIAKQGERDRANAEADIAKQTALQEGKFHEEEAKQQTEALLSGLGDMTQAQRDAATATLQTWLTTYTAMGVAGAAAAAQVRESMNKVTQATQDAIAGAGKLADKLGMKGADTGRLGNADLARSLAVQTAKIGKPDSQEDAEAKATEGYRTQIEALQKGIRDAQSAVQALETVPVEKLSEEQATNLFYLRNVLDVYRAQLPKTQAEAAAAGQKAGQAYITGQADAVEEGKMALATATKELAESENHSGVASPQALAAYRTSLTAYRDYWQRRVTTLQAGIKKDASLQGELTSALQKLAGAQKNLTSDIQGGNKSEDKEAEGLRVLTEARAAYNQVFGRSAPAYQSEIKGLEEAKAKYPELGAQLDAIIAKYRELQAARSGVASIQSLKLDFQIGFSGGQKQLQDSISNMAQGFGSLLSPMSLFAAILARLNPVGEALEALFSVLEEPLNALKEPFKLIGELIGSIIAPNLEFLAPILRGVVEVFGMVFDAIATFLRTISFGLINIKRRTSTTSAADTANAEKSRADTKNANDLEALEQQHRKQLVSDKDYEQRKFGLTLTRISQQRSADIAAAKGNAALIYEINRKYDLETEKERLDMLDRLKAAFIEIGNSLMSNIQSGVKDGLMGALKSGNFADFRTSFRANLRQSMFDAVLSAAIETAALQGILQPAITALTNAFATGNQANIDQAVRNVMKAGDQVEAKSKQIYNSLKPLRDKWGITGEDSNQTQTVSVVGEVSTPEVKISLDALGLLGNVIQTQIPAYSTALSANTAALPSFMQSIGAFGVSVAAYSVASGQMVTAGAQIYAASNNFVTAATRILAVADRLGAPASTGKYGR